MKRQDGDIMIITGHHGIVTALDAVDRLATRRVPAEMVELRSLRPLDIETVLESVAKPNRVLVLD